MDSRTIITAAAVALGFVALFFIIQHNRGENFGPPLLTECDELSVALVVHLHATEREIQAAYERLEPLAEPATRRRGFAGVDPVTGFHHLYLPELRGQRDVGRLETWGHELAHATCGRWHPDE